MVILSAALKRLISTESPLNASDFTISQRRALEQFARETRLIEITRQGRGTVYRVLNPQSLISYLRVQHPLDENSLSAELPQRSRNIGTDRNSKKGQAGHDCCYLLMKAWNSEVVWHNENDVMYPSNLTTRFGLAALQIKAGYSWYSNRPLLLVENQALFDRCDWVPEDFNGSLVYYAGQLSDVLLHWFSAKKRTDEVILFPDYDGIGLSNYVRLADAVHADTSLNFYWLPDWENKLAMFGNAVVWSNTRVQFEKSLEKLKAMNALSANFLRLGHLSQRYGKALEQESIWL
jgi:hypothetical protein